jgi:hypothetical protein
MSTVTAATKAAANEVKVTVNELTLLQAIRSAAKELKVDPVEMAVPCVNPFATKQQGSGTYASAMRKGLVQSQDYGTKDHAVSLTELGAAVLKREDTGAKK